MLAYTIHIETLLDVNKHEFMLQVDVHHHHYEEIHS